MRSVERFEQSVPAAVQPGAALHVHAPEPADPVHDWCEPHVCVPVISTQPFPSVAHVSSVVPFSQTGPVVVHAAALLHVHDAEPAAPEQTSSDGHATAVPYSRQPSPCTAHVWTVPVLPHCFCPAVQTLVHVEEQAALPAAPEHAGVGAWQGALDWTNRQLLVSVAH